MIRKIGMNSKQCCTVLALQTCMHVRLSLNVFTKEYAASTYI